MKLIGKLQDGTVFVKKGHDEEEPFEWKTDEGEFPSVCGILPQFDHIQERLLMLLDFVTCRASN